MSDDLSGLTPEQLQAALHSAQEELSDMEDERRFTLGQTGVHIGAAELARIRGHFQREEKRIQERIAALRTALGLDRQGTKTQGAAPAQSI